MIPDLASVMRKRYWIEAMIRVAALLGFVIWLLILFSSALDSIRIIGRPTRVPSGGLPPPAASFDILTLIRALLTSTPFLITAALLAVFSRRLALWIAPTPLNICPRCGYRLIALREARCPECGTALPLELLGGSDA
jgi:hypothetical protein